MTRSLIATAVLGVGLLLLAFPLVSHPAAGLAQPAAAGNNGVSPPAMIRASIGYDAADGLVIMFGGLSYTGEVLSTTWAFAHGNWTNLTSSLSTFPPGRWGASMAYDAADQELLLFGGCATIACPVSLGDTWAFTHGHWTDLTPLVSRSPAPRDLAAMAYDAALGKVLLFGGQNGTGGGIAYNDTWTFSSGQWNSTVLTPGAPPPTPRYAMGVAYLPALSAVVIFGGITTAGGGAILDDTWTFTNGTWALAFAGGAAPSARQSADFSYDDGDGYGFLFGGYNHGTYLGDAWQLDRAGWVPLNTTGPIPPASFGSMVTYDPVDHYVLFFSGEEAPGYQTSTWSFAGGSWGVIVSPPGNLNPAIGGFLVLELVFVVPIAIAVLLAVGVRAIRARRQKPGFDLRPGEPVQNVPTEGFSLKYGQALAAPILILAFLLPLDLVFVGSGTLSPFGIVLVVGLPLLLIEGLLVYVGRFNTLDSIGITAQGLLIRRPGHELRVAWDDVSLPTFPVRGKSVLFRYAAPAETTGGGFVRVTLKQARAILSYPNAPAWPISSSAAKALGVQPRKASDPPPAPAQSHRAPPVTPRSASPLRSEASPLPEDSEPELPAPPVAPPPPPPRRAAPAPYVPPPGPAEPAEYTVRCPKCGSTYPEGKYIFCRTCGSRLP